MQQLPFGLGVIEGFYGQPWPEADRIDSLGFIASESYSYYVYAPKADKVLRRHWRERWDSTTESHLRALAASARATGIAWGVGLSPLGLVENLDDAGRRALRSKLRYLDDFGIDLLCILFDDMPRGVDDLTQRQCEIVAEAAASGNAKYLLVCPSYYTRDPILERLFGVMPPRYWEDLGRGLPAEAGIFWTGERVCSDSYSVAELQQIAQCFGRKPVLWDNYPVNDGARMSAFLHLDAFRGRPAELSGALQAHFVNPMNQARLSRVALGTLPQIYAQGSEYDATAAFMRSACAAAGVAGAALLSADLERFQRRGRGTFDVAEVRSLVRRYEPFDAPWSRELTAWLRGEYAFDPACLTD